MFKHESSEYVPGRGELCLHTKIKIQAAARQILYDILAAVLARLKPVYGVLDIEVINDSRQQLRRIIAVYILLMDCRQMQRPANSSLFDSSVPVFQFGSDCYVRTNHIAKREYDSAIPKEIIFQHGISIRCELSLISDICRLCLLHSDGAAVVQIFYVAQAYAHSFNSSGVIDRWT